MNEKLIFQGLEEKKRKELVDQLKKSVMPDDVIAAIFSFLTVDKIPLDVRKIHSAVFKLKQENPEMFEDFIFSSTDYYPYSSLLERVLFRLQNADLINTVNPGFQKCIVSEESKEHIKKDILPLFRDEEKKKLQKMGEAFQKIVL